MNKKILFFLLIPFLGFSQVQIGQDIVGDNLRDHFGHSVSLSDNGKTVVINAFNDTNGGYGYVKVFQNNSSIWTQVGQTLSDTSIERIPNYRTSLSADGSRFVVSWINKNNSNDKNIRVYQNVSGLWTQIGQDMYLGSSAFISSDGTVLAVAFDEGPTGNQIVRLYKDLSGVWTQIGQDIDGSQYGWLSRFGYVMSLSVDGSVVAISAFSNDINGVQSAGSVFVYKNISGTWTKIGQDLNGELIIEYFGTSIDLSSDGSVLAISSHKLKNNIPESIGNVKVYKNISNVWQQIGNTILGGRNPGGVSISADGNTLAFASDPNHTSSPAVLRVYKNLSGVWAKIGNDIQEKEPDALLGRYSASISRDGTIVAVGAPFLSFDPQAKEGYVQIWDYSKALSNDDFVSQNFNIYPNPTSDVLNISLENNLVLEQITIYNNLGQVVKTAIENVIDVSQLAKGLYFVEVATNQGKATKKVIIN